MTPPATFSFDAPGDAQRAAELKRVKAQATLVLAGTLALFVVARMLSHVHPAFGFVAAFAEAATIGGLADWYAVVALFKRPLGLPIPHTAIIQGNQQRIAENLQQLAMHDQALLRNWRLFPRDFPNSFKHNAGLPRQPLNLRNLGEIR